MARSKSTPARAFPSPDPTHTTISGRVLKTPLSGTSVQTRAQRARQSEFGNRTCSLQDMVVESHDAVLGASSSAPVNRSKGKGKTKVKEQDETMEEIAPEEIGAAQVEEDADMQQAIYESMCPIIDKDEKPFQIMDLPTEIRLEVYRACLTRPYNILLSKREQPKEEQKEKKSNDSKADASAIAEDQAEADDSETEGNRVTRRTTQRRGGSNNTGPNSDALMSLGQRNITSDGGRPIRLISTRSTGATTTSSSGSTRVSTQYIPGNTSTTTSHDPSVRNTSTGVVLRSGNARRNAGRNARNAAPAPTNEPPRNQNQDPLLVNILCVSKQIYKEARSVLYGENLFTLDLATAMPTLANLHQRSRRQIKHVELEIPTYNEILERFQETVRLSLRYCLGLQHFVIHMPFTLPGADGSGTTGNTTVYANGFDILRWLPQTCNIVLTGNVCAEIETVVNKHMQLAKRLDKVSHASLQYRVMTLEECEECIKLQSEKKEVRKVSRSSV